MMDPTIREQHWYIAREHLKEKYQDSRRIKAFCVAVEKNSAKIDVQVMRNGTVKFVVIGPGRGVNRAVAYIQGELINKDAPSSVKSDTQADGDPLPTATLQRISGPREAARILTKDEQQAHSRPLTEASLRKLDRMTGACQLRQFACGPCDHPWWRTVPTTKPVSSCKHCQVKYDPLPVDKQFGIARFLCPTCDYEFYRRCTATDTYICHKCNTVVGNPYIHPDLIRKRSTQSSSHAQSRSNDADASKPALVPALPSIPEQPLPPLPSYIPPPVPSPVLPQLPQPRRVINASTPHESTGSTVSTFLTQRDEFDDFDDLEDDLLLSQATAKSDSHADIPPKFIKKAVLTKTKLGEGSYGRVDEVKIDGDIFAAKKFKYIGTSSSQTGFWAKSGKEIAILFSLTHRNIVQCHGICFTDEEPDEPRLLMERLNTSLHAYLCNPRSANLALSKKVCILHGIASGLLYLHSNDPAIIHRDLTARNVLLAFGSSLLAKISDFGNARIADIESGEQKTMSAFPGTRVYMPPEACNEKAKYSKKLDIFSYGHLTLFVATQIYPCDLLAATYMQLNSRVAARSEVERRHMYFEQLHRLGESHELITLVEECLHNDPHKRPSADDILRKLQDMAPQGAITAAEDDVEPDEDDTSSTTSTEETWPDIN